MTPTPLPLAAGCTSNSPTYPMAQVSECHPDHRPAPAAIPGCGSCGEQAAAKLTQGLGQGGGAGASTVRIVVTFGLTPSPRHSCIRTHPDVPCRGHVCLTGLPASAIVVVCEASAILGLPCRILGCSCAVSQGRCSPDWVISIAVQESYEYSDPITQFLRSLYVEYDFEGTSLHSVDVQVFRGSLLLNHAAAQPAVMSDLQRELLRWCTAYVERCCAGKTAARVGIDAQLVEGTCSAFMD